VLVMPLIMVCKSINGSLYSRNGVADDRYSASVCCEAPEKDPIAFIAVMAAGVECCGRYEIPRHISRRQHID